MVGLCFLLFALSTVSVADAISEPVDEYATASFRNGRLLVLECSPPGGDAAESFLKRYLSADADWKTYAGKGAVAIGFNTLSPAVQRRVLLAIFKEDFVDEQGWHHTVLYTGRDQETLWSLSEWLTGKGTNHDAIAQLNKLPAGNLQEAQAILFPRELLLEVMREPTVTPLAKDLQEAAEEPEEPEEVDLSKAAEELAYTRRGANRYAVYKLKRGEALYTAVVVRFTDYRENADILAACDTVQEESGIKDVHDMKPGTPIFIPVDMLSDRFKPEGTRERAAYEASIEEANRLRGQVTSKDLEGVVVILDPGHGGKDDGTNNVDGGFRLYEDELNYDIVCRVKKILETQTRAKVYVTMLDPDQGYNAQDIERFTADEDEKVLTTPNYWNGDAKVSANLRWYLANSIYRKEKKAGVDPRKIIFTSFHCDALFNGKLRGAMVYIPGAKYRKDRETGWPPGAYDKYAEFKEHPEAKSTAEERRRDEALSRNFAVTLLEQLGKAQIKRHSVGDPVRNVIRQSGGKEYVVAVLRNTEVPTKVLIECANLTNPTDCKWISQPWWRQRFAEAYVEALKAYYR
ncbi:MAG: N-acetylmuramoyl-L-alanine amidase [Candidatus Hydrogenedentes bacterium]|nr:N-acetylmuramoyl-L-alanine amidase [Candidatus Hydrogenedentota bacterium]